MAVIGTEKLPRESGQLILVGSSTLWAGIWPVGRVVTRRPDSSGWSVVDPAVGVREGRIGRRPENNFTGVLAPDPLVEWGLTKISGARQRDLSPSALSLYDRGKAIVMSDVIDIERAANLEQLVQRRTLLSVARCVSILRNDNRNKDAKNDNNNEYFDQGKRTRDVCRAPAV